MNSRLPVALIFGPPGSGKGTQAKNLVNIAPFVHISTGDIFRSIPKGSETARLLATYTDHGLLVPDEVTVKIWKSYVDGLIATFRFNPNNQWLLLDGIPRTKEQAIMIEPMVDVRLIFNLQVQHEEILAERLTKRAIIEGRRDDAKPDVVKQRLHIYASQTRDTLSYYSPAMISNIQADQSPVMVLHDMLPFVEQAFAHF